MKEHVLLFLRAVGGIIYDIEYFYKRVKEARRCKEREMINMLATKYTSIDEIPKEEVERVKEKKGKTKSLLSDVIFKAVFLLVN